MDSAVQEHFWSSTAGLLHAWSWEEIRWQPPLPLSRKEKYTGSPGVTGGLAAVTVGPGAVCVGTADEVEADGPGTGGRGLPPVSTTGTATAPAATATSPPTDSATIRAAAEAARARAAAARAG